MLVKGGAGVQEQRSSTKISAGQVKIRQDWRYAWNFASSRCFSRWLRKRAMFMRGASAPVSLRELPAGGNGWRDSDHGTRADWGIARAGDDWSGCVGIHRCEAGAGQGMGRCGDGRDREAEEICGCFLWISQCGDQAGAAGRGSADRDSAGDSGACAGRRADSAVALPP